SCGSSGSGWALKVSPALGDPADGQAPGLLSRLDQLGHRCARWRVVGSGAGQRPGGLNPTASPGPKASSDLATSRRAAVGGFSALPRSTTRTATSPCT